VQHIDQANKVLLAERVSFMEQLSDAIRPAVDPADSPLYDLAHEFERCADGIEDGFEGTPV
jgi:hypothetical protein